MYCKAGVNQGVGLVGLVCGFLDRGSKHGVGLVGLVRRFKFRLSCDGLVYGEGRVTGCWLGCLF